MKTWNRILGLSLSAALLIGTITGCTTPTEGNAEGSPDPTASVETEAPLVKTEDMVQKLVGIPADTVMYTVDGKDVTAEQFYYWLATAIENVGYYNFGSADSIDWTAEKDGKKITDFILSDAKQTAQFYRTVETEAAKNKVTLSDAERREVVAQINQNIEQLGEEEYASQLQQMGLSDASFRHMVEVSYLANSMQEYLYGESGKTPPTSENVVALAEEQGLMLAKHILIKTVGEDGTTPLSEEEKTAAKTKAEGFLSQLTAAEGDAQITLFDTLMNENSEDGRSADGTLASPDGYLFGAGEMVQAFEDKTKTLAYNQISDLVETEYGYHIILRLSPDNDEMRKKWATAKMKETTDAWLAASKVEDSEEMSKVDVQGFYEKISAYRASVQESSTPTPTPTPSNSTSPTPSA